MTQKVQFLKHCVVSAILHSISFFVCLYFYASLAKESSSSNNNNNNNNNKLKIEKRKRRKDRQFACLSDSQSVTSEFSLVHGVADHEKTVDHNNL